MEQTRTSLHGVAELLLAGPQYAASDTIRLRVVEGGFATVAEPDLRGVSPGDASIGEPYAYVGPHAQRFGAFWNQPFGAARTVAELGDVPEVLAFFREGMARAADPAEG